ncbi:MAG: hypothetical protein ABR511_13325 [Acidimicrobiales bacterium]
MGGEDAGIGPRRGRGSGVVVVADMEAGLEHLSWAGGTLRHVDALLVVLEPTAKVLMTAERAHALALELGIPRVAFVGNRYRPGEEQRLVDFAAAKGGDLLALVPYDEAVRQADLAATCLLDHAPESPSVAAIAALADRLEADYLAAPVG